MLFGPGDSFISLAPPLLCATQIFSLNVKPKLDDDNELVQSISQVYSDTPPPRNEHFAGKCTQLPHGYCQEDHRSQWLSTLRVPHRHKPNLLCIVHEEDGNKYEGRKGCSLPIGLMTVFEMDGSIQWSTLTTTLTLPDLVLHYCYCPPQKLHGETMEYPPIDFYKRKFVFL